MKRPIYYLTLSLCFALMLSSCSKKDIDTSPNPPLTTQEKVARLGFDTTGMVISNDTVVVEGDIILTLSNLEKTSPRQASGIDLSNGAYPISYANQKYIVYYVSADLSSWESAITAAFSKYSYSNFNLTFTKTTNINQANLRIESGSLATGDALFPASGQVGNLIRVNNTLGLNEAQKIFVLVHEIGHTIGLRHTDWRATEYEYISKNGVIYGAYTIPGTPNSSNEPDPASIFNSGVGTNGTPSWTGFSAFDRTALFTLYPSFSAAELITTPALPAAGGTPPIIRVGTKITARVNIPYWRAGGLTYQWQVQGATVVLNNGANLNATVTDPNTAAVLCQITNAYGETTSVSASFGAFAID